MTINVPGRDVRLSVCCQINWSFVRLFPILLLVLVHENASKEGRKAKKDASKNKRRIFILIFLNINISKFIVIIALNIEHEMDCNKN
jgi:hypothetical protein